MSGACTKQELIAAAGYNVSNAQDYAKGFNLIGRMIKRKIISHNQTTLYRKYWTVTADVKTHRIPTVHPTPEEVAAKIMPKEVMVELREFETVGKVKLISLAKEFAWRENTDSLRDFIVHIEKALK